MALILATSETNASPTDSGTFPVNLTATSPTGLSADLNATPNDSMFSFAVNATEGTPVQVWSVTCFGNIGRVLVPGNQGSPS